MSYNIQCCICFEFIQHYSKCENCIESFLCYDCEKKWTQQNKDPTICFICKKKSRNMVYFKNIQIYQSIIENSSRELLIPINDEDIQHNQLNEYIRPLKFCIKFVMFIIVLYIISYISAEVIQYIDLYILLFVIFCFITVLFIIWLYMCIGS